jgi:choice-of-anchor A domain-containing protein
MLRLSLLISALFVSANVSAYTLDLGLAGEFNGFILGNMNATNSDIEGRLAVGGNLILNNYSIGSTLTNSQGNRDDLIAGGSLTITNTRIYNGNARSGVTATLDNTVGFYSGSDPNINNGSYIPGNPVDFATINKELIQKSAQWGGLLTNQTSITQDESGNLKLTGSNSDINIFSLTSLELAKTKSFWLDIPENAGALINIDGKEVTMTDFGFFRTVNGIETPVIDNGGDKAFTQGVLFNLFNATSLNMSAIAIQGSLLAPNADTYFYNGQINGNLILGSLDLMTNMETGEMHNVPFVSSPVPVPTVGWMLLLPLISIIRSRPSARLKTV